MLEVPTGRLAVEVNEQLVDPLTPITVKTRVTEEQVAYLYEHQEEFPGVQIQQTYLRSYPYGSVAAQILGYVGEISPEELKAKAKQGYLLGDKLGKTGVESEFDRYLRGEAGLAQIRVDSMGRPQSPLQLQRDARPGHAVRLTIDIAVQRAAERALRLGIETARANKSYNANGGAIVALDPRDGAVLAMASYPTYKPSVYVGRVDPKKIAPLVDNDAAKEANYPGLNRVTQVEYPPGSTWKPVTALAAMQEHLLSPYQSIQCTPQAEYGLDKQVFKNWDPFVNRPMTLYEALATSCDTYFYDVGYRFYTGGRERWDRLQEWARVWGFGAPAGIDIGGEADGLVPTPAWRKRTFTSDWDKAWNPGDSIQLAIGQKDVTVTPLQMARFYAMIANGGKLVTPVPRVGGRDARLAGPEPGRASAGSHRTRRATQASTRLRSRSCARVSTRPRTRVTGRPPGCSAPIPSRSRARQGRRRRSCRCPATRPITSRIRRGGAGTGPTTGHASSSAR